MKILTIIPAKLDSKRLTQKNLRQINGKSLVEYSIEYAKQSKYNPTIVVSSESTLVREVAEASGVEFNLRDYSLCGDVEVVDVYINIINAIDEVYDLVVALQPDHPDREHSFDYCVDYMVENKYDDLITIEPSFKRSGSVRIFKYDYLKSGYVSRRIGCIKDDATDIHYIEDLERASENLSKK
jgi:CMP-N,N'-diacetyllegionaminic acid synthase